MFALSLPAGPGHDAQLRPLEPWQSKEFFEHIERARATVDPWIPWAAASSDPVGARATLQRYADGQAADTKRLYGIWLDGTLVGGAMFVRFDAESGIGEIGVWMEPAGQGHGLVTAGVRHLIDWAFTVRGLRRLEWRTSPANVRSSNVARRLGMQLDGVLRQSYTHREVRHDTEVWSLLTEEWKP
jgi:ribosomal-protein-serine acetyltransferase